MSGPYSFTITVISGQDNSGLLVSGASAFLYRGWMSIDPISTNKNLLEELYLCLDIFSKRGCFVQQPDEAHARYFAKRIDTDFVNYSISAGLFWIALDEQGYSLAKELFAQQHGLPDEKVYKSVCKLNLVAQPMPPYPETAVSTEFWRQIYGKLNRIDWDLHSIKPQKERWKLFEQYMPMTAIEKEYYSWYKLLHDNLLPWRDTIGRIQSDWS
jgi:hypothetical protein